MTSFMNDVVVQTWSPKGYREHAAFVPAMTEAVVQLLELRSEDAVLDVGCGDGTLTLQLKSKCRELVAVDSSAEQIEAARELGLNAHVADAQALPYIDAFDVVFSNATLHWMRDPQCALASIFRALRPGGRFVAEQGGQGCMAAVRMALYRALEERGIAGPSRDPWDFPSVEEQRSRLEQAGFEVDTIALVGRPTPLPTGIRGWLETFAQNFVAGFSPSARAEFLDEVERFLRPVLCDRRGTWMADYTRLRYRAYKRR